jgi:sec-independent protein translocase protein TatA
VFNVGPLELIVVLIIALIVLGPQRLPDVAKSLGRGMREFRSALESPDDDEDEDEDEAHEEVEAKPAPPAEGDYQKEAESSESSSSSKGLV